MKKDAEHISVNNVSYFPTTQINGFTYIMSEAAIPSFPSTAVQNIFGNTGGRVLMFVMTAITFNWIFLRLLIQLIN